MPSLGHIFWKNYFTAYDVLNHAIPYQELIEVLLKKVSPKIGDGILDAGAGTGNLSLKMVVLGASVTALDSSPEGLSICKQKNKQIETILHDLEKPLPFPDSSFDKIVSNNTIYLTRKESRPIIFKEFFRVLKPGGLLVVSNIHKNFKPIIIYKEHIQKYYKKFGISKTFLQIMGLLPATLKMFYYNGKIKKSNQGNLISFMGQDEHTILMQNAGFKNISIPEATYAKQAFLTTAHKL